MKEEKLERMKAEGREKSYNLSSSLLNIFPINNGQCARRLEWLLPPPSTHLSRTAPQTQM